MRCMPVGVSIALDFESASPCLDIGFPSAATGCNIGFAMSELDIVCVWSKLDIGVAWPQLDTGFAPSELDVGPILSQADVSFALSYLGIGFASSQLDIGSFQNLCETCPTPFQSLSNMFDELRMIIYDVWLFWIEHIWKQWVSFTIIVDTQMTTISIISESKLSKSNFWRHVACYKTRMPTYSCWSKTLCTSASSKVLAEQVNIIATHWNCEWG